MDRSQRLRPFTLLLAVLTIFPFASDGEDRLNPSVSQLVVGVAPTWDSMTGQIQRFDKTEEGWRPAGPPVPVLFGKDGVAWGRGLIKEPDEGPVKMEHDHRAPAGVFRIGIIYTYDRSLPPGANYPFHTVGDGDAWVDDVNNPHYNQHVTVDPKNPPSWFEKQKMRRGDFAYRWLVEIRHNADPPLPGHGSAIFFHIRRGPTRPSAGCTTMAETDLVELIRWLRAGANPVYVCLPRTEYLNRWKAWGLPDPAFTGLFTVHRSPVSVRRSAALWRSKTLFL
ncbi:MAG: L,D-transpeptidase family protein [Verrucomicrobia bacterium]|nr:L,D-transpeptidase family protein [Verrucomicrobiota bacterium]